MAKQVKIDIGIACNKNQIPDWWVPLLAEVARLAKDANIEIGQIIAKPTAVPDHNKNSIMAIALGQDHRKPFWTDESRNAVVEEFKKGRADYIYWLDDDTVHPPGALAKMVSLKLPFVSGLYYSKRPPCHPIAYYRMPNGGYIGLWDFRRGELVTVDSTGMGCALIAREVYEGIQATHDAYLRENFTVQVLPKDAKESVDAGGALNLELLIGKAVNDKYFVQRITPATPEVFAERKLAWPFYVLEYSRTEDHFFCECAERAGYKPVVDTSIDCQHWMERPVSRDTYLNFYLQYKDDIQAAMSAVDRQGEHGRSQEGA